MVEIKILLGIIGGVIALGGGIVGFFTMQTRQNMKIEQLQREVKELKRKQSDFSHYQIASEKDLVAINVKLDHILDAIEDLKKSGNQ